MWVSKHLKDIHSVIYVFNIHIQGVSKKIFVNVSVTAGTC